MLPALPSPASAIPGDRSFAASWWHWFFLGQTSKPAERVISADPDAWYRPDRERMGEENYADYRRAIHDPETVHTNSIACPMLLVWALQDDMEDLYGDRLAVWEAWAGDVRGARIDCGHHIAEEEPEQLAAELRAFLTALRSRR